MKILARLFSEWVPRIKFQIKKAKFEHNVFQMGPSVFWITSALGPLSKSYFVPLKLGGQRQHVKIWKCLVFCPTFRQFSSPQPFPFHNHQCGHCRCLLFVCSHYNSLLVSDDLDQAMWHTPVFPQMSFGHCVMLWAILPLSIPQELILCRQCDGGRTQE